MPIRVLTPDSHRNTAIRRGLLTWFRREKRDLPWRRTRDPYAIWLSEIMLQQTRVEQCVPFYQRFLVAFPTVQALARAREGHVLKLWEGLGYYTRARNLLKAARVIASERDGRFPETAAAWQQLPGVGRYTAGAIASIAFGEAAPVLDGNVKRVLARVFDISSRIDDGKTLKRLWALAAALVPPRAPGDFNQAMMELGARICVPRPPRCDICPIAKSCLARSRGTQAKRPIRRAKSKAPHHEAVVAAICKRGRYLLAKRPAEGLLGGFWEFPGGKIEIDETHAQALRREIREELGIRIRVGEHLATVSHSYSHFHVTLHVYRCEHIAGNPRPKIHTELKWVPRAHITRYPLPKANHKFLDLL